MSKTFAFGATDLAEQLEDLLDMPPGTMLFSLARGHDESIIVNCTYMRRNPTPEQQAAFERYLQRTEVRT